MLQVENWTAADDATSYCMYIAATAVSGVGKPSG